MELLADLDIGELHPDLEPEHLEELLGRVRGASSALGVKLLSLFPHEPEVYTPRDFHQRVVLRDHLLHRRTHKEANLVAFRAQHEGSSSG